MGGVRVPKYADNGITSFIPISGIPPSRRGRIGVVPVAYSDELRAEMVRLYTTPLPDGTWLGSKTIGLRLGVAPATVRSAVTRAGLPTRDARESHAHGKRCKPVKNVPVGEPPSCHCGCGQPTAWNQKENRWRARIEGHRVPPPAWRGRSRGRAGSLNASWKGGVTPERQRLYRSMEWRRLVASVFERDGYHCARCGEPKRGKGSLHAHHVRPWADHPALRMDPANLVTLCQSCHLWVHSRANVEGELLAA